MMKTPTAAHSQEEVYLATITLTRDEYEMVMLYRSVPEACKPLVRRILAALVKELNAEASRYG
jgi:hypothetical protein